jgi:hypothetical protein
VVLGKTGGGLVVEPVSFLMLLDAVDVYGCLDDANWL